MQPLCRDHDRDSCGGGRRAAGEHTQQTMCPWQCRTVSQQHSLYVGRRCAHAYAEQHPSSTACMLAGTAASGCMHIKTCTQWLELASCLTIQQVLSVLSNCCTPSTKHNVVPCQTRTLEQQRSCRCQAHAPVQQTSSQVEPPKSMRKQNIIL